VKIAVLAGVSKIVDRLQAAVLYGNDVFDVVRVRVIDFMKLSILATMCGANGDDGANGIIHERIRRALVSPWP
jgi:hypothetical protein